MRLVFVFCVVIGALFVWRTGLALPPLVASHSAADGTANGFMSRASNGVVIKIISGLRTYAGQDALYAQGRTTPGKARLLLATTRVLRVQFTRTSHTPSSPSSSLLTRTRP